MPLPRPACVVRSSLLVLLATTAAGCKKKPASSTTSRWHDLGALPVQVEAPTSATVGQTDAPRGGQAPAMLVSARECITIVARSSSSDPELARTELASAAAAGNQVVGAQEELAGGGWVLPVRRGDKAWFVAHRTLDGVGYRCEPFAARAEVGCERRMCASLRTRPLGAGSGGSAGSGSASP